MRRSKTPQLPMSRPAGRQGSPRPMPPFLAADFTESREVPSNELPGSPARLPSRWVEAWSVDNEVRTTRQLFLLDNTSAATDTLSHSLAQHVQARSSPRRSEGLIQNIRWGCSNLFKAPMKEAEEDALEWGLLWPPEVFLSRSPSPLPSKRLLHPDCTLARHRKDESVRDHQQGFTIGKKGEMLRASMAFWDVYLVVTKTYLAWGCHWRSENFIQC